MSKTEQKEQKPLGEQFKETYLTRKRKREDGAVQDNFDKITEICTIHLEKDDPGCRVKLNKLGDFKEAPIRDGVIKKLKENKF